MDFSIFTSLAELRPGAVGDVEGDPEIVLSSAFSRSNMRTCSLNACVSAPSSGELLASFASVSFSLALTRASSTASGFCGSPLLDQYPHGRVAATCTGGVQCGSGVCMDKQVWQRFVWHCGCDSHRCTTRRRFPCRELLREGGERRGEELNPFVHRAETLVQRRQIIAGHVVFCMGDSLSPPALPCPVGSSDSCVALYGSPPHTRLGFRSVLCSARVWEVGSYGSWITVSLAAPFPPHPLPVPPPLQTPPRRSVRGKPAAPSLGAAPPLTPTPTPLPPPPVKPSPAAPSKPALLLPAVQ